MRARRVRLRVSACVREVCGAFWNEESAGLDESKVGSTESKEKEVVEEAALLPPYPGRGGRGGLVWWVGVWGEFCACAWKGGSPTSTAHVCIE